MLFRSTLGVTPFNVAFTDVSNGTITNRYWDFGDGTTTNVTVAGVSHTYVTTGVFPVALTVSGPVGQNTQTQNQLITVLDPNADADGDGFTNAQELQAGTNTFDPNSYSHITNVQIVGGDVQITFPSVSGKLYDLEANSDLTTTNWNVLQTNIPGTGSPVTVTDTGGANATNRCYRVGVLP